MKKITMLSMLLFCLTIQQTIHAYYFSPDELGGSNPALQEAMEKEPVRTLLIICCPCYSLIGTSLLLHTAEKAPHIISCLQRVMPALREFNCCSRLKEVRTNFIETHDNGLLAALTEQPKQIKMKDE